MAKRIMVVDDSAIIRQVEESVLKAAGFEVVVANDGREALAKMATGAFHLILTDLNMPNLDGVEFIKAVRTTGTQRLVPIVMVTTESKDSKKKEGKAAGATAWVVKPFTPEQLLAVVHKVLG
jgi:two-component system, chemotaxis family, chemotaxis protein CheY